MATWYEDAGEQLLKAAALIEEANGRVPLDVVAINGSGKQERPFGAAHKMLANTIRRLREWGASGEVVTKGGSKLKMGRLRALGSKYGALAGAAEDSRKRRLYEEALRDMLHRPGVSDEDKQRFAALLGEKSE